LFVSIHQNHYTVPELRLNITTDDRKRSRFQDVMIEKNQDNGQHQS